MSQIKSNTCPYCGGQYTLNAGGCVNRCRESTALHTAISLAALSDPGEVEEAAHILERKKSKGDIC